MSLIVLKLAGSESQIFLWVESGVGLFFHTLVEVAYFICLILVWDAY
jgi:hypothetical protein